MRNRSRAISRAFCGLVAILTLFARPVAAQTPSPLLNWQYSAGEALAPLQGELPEWQIVLGADAALSPAFEGAQRYRPTGGPIADIEYRGRLFASTGEGIGVNLFRGRTSRAGVAIAYDLGRDADVDRSWLRGLGDVHAAPEGKLFAEYGLLPFVLTADLRRGFGGHDGYIGDLGVYLPVFGSEKGFVFVGPSITFADERYMQAYFGVTPAQAARSRFRPFSPGAGVKSAGFGISSTWFVMDHWLIEMDAAYERLLGEAAASPITETSSQFVVSLGLGYKF